MSMDDRQKDGEWRVNSQDHLNLYENIIVSVFFIEFDLV